MKHKITKTLLRTLALALTICATCRAWAAAPTPVVVWDGDFGTLSKTVGDYTYTINNTTAGNSVASDGSYIQVVNNNNSHAAPTITSTAGAFGSGGTTVIVKYGNMLLSDGSNRALLTLLDAANNSLNGGNARVGVYHNNNSFAWVKGGQGAGTTQAASFTSSGTVAFSYNSSGTSACYANKLLNGSASLDTATFTQPVGVCIGGVDNTGNSGKFYAQRAMKIYAVAIFDTALTAEQISEYNFSSDYNSSVTTDTTLSTSDFTGTKDVYIDATELTTDSILTIESGVSIGTLSVKIASGKKLTVSGSASIGAVHVGGTGTLALSSVSISNETFVKSGGTLEISGLTVPSIWNCGTVDTYGETTLSSAKLFASGSKLNVRGGKTTLNTSGTILSGNIEIAKNAELENRTTDALNYGTATTIDVYGTLNMGSSRWTMKAANILNLHTGGVITGVGQDPYGALDAAEALTINIKGTSTISAKLRVRGNITLNVESGTLTYSDYGTSTEYQNNQLIKTGVGTIESSVAPYCIWTVNEGQVIQSVFPSKGVSIASGATFTMKNLSWTDQPGLFSGLGTLELFNDRAFAGEVHQHCMHTVTGVTFPGTLKFTATNTDTYGCGHVISNGGFLSDGVRPQLELNTLSGGTYSKLFFGTDYNDATITTRDLKGSGDLSAKSSGGTAQNQTLETMQTQDSVFSGNLLTDDSGDDEVHKTNLHVIGDDSGTVKTLTISGANTSVGELSVGDGAKVAFASTGSWSNGSVVVEDGGVLESQNSAAIAATLKIEEGATLKFADGVPLAATAYDWSGVSNDGSVNIDLSAIAPSATPVTLIASDVGVLSDKFTVTASQTPATLSIESGALKATFANVWRNGSWSGELVANQNATLYISQNAALTVSEALSLGAVTVVNEVEEDVTLTVYGAGAFTATSISLPENVTLKIARNGNWNVPISGAGAIEIDSGITATINAAVTTSGGFVVGDNATLTVTYANISSSTGAFSGDSTSTVKMALELGTTNITAYENLNSLWKFNDSDYWTGAVEISGTVGVFGLKQFGNTSSKVIVNGLSSYATSTSYSSVYDWNKVGTLEIGSGGWTINGSYSDGKIDLRAAVVGSGTITSTATGGTRIFFTGDMSGFEGSLAFGDSAASQFQVLNTTETDPTSDTKCVDYVAKTIVIASDSSATIGSSATWTASGGLYVRGTLAFDGAGTFSGNATTYSGASLDYSGSTATPSAITGALTFDSGTAIVFPALAGAADYKMAGTLSESVTNTVSLAIGTHDYRAPCGFIATTGKIEFPALATLNGSESPVNWSEMVWDAKPATINSNTTVVLNVGGNTTLEVNEAVSIHKFIVNGVANAVLTVLADGGSFVASESVAVKGGVLQQGSASVLGTTPLIVVENGATFDMNGFSVNGATHAYIAGAGAGNWPWALTSSSGAFSGTIQYLTLTANATVGGQYQIVLGANWAGSNGYLGGYTLTKTGVGELYVRNFNTLDTGSIVISEGTLTTAQWNCLNRAGGTTTLTIASVATVRSTNQEANPPAVTELNWDGTLNTASRHFIVKNTLNGGGSTAYLNFEANATANLKRDLNVTSKLTLAGAMTFLKHSEAEDDVVVDVSGSLAASGAISVGEGVTLKLGTNRPTGVITVAEGGTLAVKQLNATDVIELATSAEPASVVLYDASGEVVSNKRVTYSDGKLTIMLSKPTLEASGTVAFDTALNWVGSTMPEANGDAIIELLGDAEITVASAYTLGNLTITGSGEVSFSGAGSVSAANIYLKNGAKLVRNANISATTGIDLNSGTVLKINGVTESVVISGAGAVETYGDVTMSASNTFTGGITAKSGTLSTTTTSGFGMDKSGSGYSELSLITVEDGACVDLNNTKDHCFALKIAGKGVQQVNGTYSGAVKNTGVEMNYGSRQTASLTLTADALVDVSSGWGLVQNGHNEAYLNLNGHTLTFRGTGTVPMVKVTAANSGTLVFDGATLMLSNYASNLSGVDIVIKGCPSINLAYAPSALGSLTLKPTASGTTASAWNLPAGCVPAVDTSNVDHSGLSDGQEVTLFTAPGGTTLTSSTISAQVNGRYTATVSGNTVTATFHTGLPSNFLHYNFDEGAAVDTGKAADSITQISSVGEASSVTLVDARNGKAVQVHTNYTPYWGSYESGLSPFHEGNVSVATVAKLNETDIILWGLGSAAGNLAVGLVVTDAHTAKVVARKGTSTVDTLATATVTQDLTSGWHFFAVVSDENGTTLYVDDTTASSNKGIPAGIGQQGQLGSFHGGAFGANKVGSSGYCLDDWRVYDTKLTAGEVSEIMKELMAVTITVPVVANTTVTVTADDVAQVGVDGDGVKTYSVPFGSAVVVTYAANSGYWLSGTSTYNIASATTDATITITDTTVNALIINDGVEVGYMDDTTAFVTNTTGSVTIPASGVSAVKIAVTAASNAATVTSAGLVLTSEGVVTVYATDVNGVIDLAKDITGAFKVTDNGGGSYTIELDDEASVNGVKVKPETAADSPMVVAAGGAPAFKIKTIPGLWYAAEVSDSPSSGFAVATGTIVQADSETTTLPAATAPTTGAKYYRIAVGASKAALTTP